MSLGGYDYQPYKIANRHSTERTNTHMDGYEEQYRLKRENQTTTETMEFMNSTYTTYIGIKQEALYNISQGDNTTWSRWLGNYEDTVKAKNEAVGDLYVKQFDTEQFWQDYYIAPKHNID